MNQNDALKLTTITDRIGDENSARKLLESVRWPEGPVCPHCGEINNARQLQARPGSKRPVRKGVRSAPRSRRTRRPCTTSCAMTSRAMML